jgi:hypothetical protein
MLRLGGAEEADDMLNCVRSRDVCHLAHHETAREEPEPVIPGD